MSRQFFEDGFEDFLKDGSHQLRMHPSERVWDQIRSRMHPNPKWPYITGAVIIFVLGVGTGIWLNEEMDDAAADTNITLAQSEASHIPTKELAFSPARESTINISPASKAAVFKLGGIPSKDDKWNGGSNMPASIYSLAWVDQKASKTHAQLSDLVPAAILADQSVFPTSYIRSTIDKANKQSPRLSSPASIQKEPSHHKLLRKLGRFGKKTGIQVYAAPSVSYRRMVGTASNTSYPYTNGFSYSANYGFAKDVNDAVYHKPGIGFELGSALVYPIGRSFRVKAGLQLNISNYDIEAYTYMPELAPLSANRNGTGQSINAISYFRNTNGFDKTWLRNSHVMVSMPLGLEFSVSRGRRLSFTIASTLQPTYNLHNKSYLISTNLKNYAQEPSLLRNWNLNAGAEAYVSVHAGTYKWIMGPQLRYQAVSSYKNDYPIAEHLIDYGFKIGIQKTIK